MKMLKNGLVLTLCVVILLLEECLSAQRELLQKEAATQHGTVRIATPHRKLISTGRYGQDQPDISSKLGMRQVTTEDRWDSLGFGVQPYDSLFEHTKLRSRVLDLGSFDPSSFAPSRVVVKQVDNLRIDKHAEAGFDEFTRQLRIDRETNTSAACFKTGVMSHYAFETTQSTDQSFALTASVVERAHIRVKEPTIQNLRSLVIPSVADFLAKNSPPEIFRVYGTHVTTGLVVGGELNLWSSSQTSKFSSKEEFSNSVSASFKKFVAGSASLSVEELRLSEKTNSVEGLIVRGGTFREGPNAEKDWIDSTAENAQEIAYLPDGIVPIWSLIPNGAQANRIRTWYERISDPTTIILKRFSSSRFVRLPETPHPEAHIFVPRGWKVVSGGANIQFSRAGQLLTKSFPIVENERPVGWHVQSKDHISSDHGKIRAHAIAIWDPFDSYDVVVRKAISDEAQHPAVNVTLPEGYTLVGGGASVLFHPPGNMLVANYPVLERTWSASSKDHLRASPSRIEAYVIGIRLRDGGRPKERVKSLSFGPLQHPAGTVTATRGYGIIGGGAQVSKGGVGNLLVNLIPHQFGKSFFASAKDHLRVDQERLTVYAIELPDVLFVEKIEEVLGLDPML